MGGSSAPYADAASTFEAFERHVSPGKARMFRELQLELVMGKREGAYFEDAFSGARYLNCHCNGGVFNLGHRHPELLATFREALEDSDIGNHHLVSGWRACLARALSATTGDVLSGVVFGVGGGEAVDVAIKCCRAATKRRGVVSVRGGYHGHTGLALAAGDPSFREPVLSSSEAFCQVPFNDLAAMDQALTTDVAAVILEPIPATLGMPLPRPGYLEAVSDLCRQRGAKLIVDEVQTGLGRTGKFWAYQHHDFQPDVVVSGKGLGGGLYPISATLMTPELHALFLEHPFVHVSTCGGSELGCQLALKVLEITQRPGLLEQVELLGAQLEAGLTPPPGGGRAGFEVRRRGLMLGLKLSAPGAAIPAMQALIKRGVFALYAAHDTSVVQLMPPLILQPSQADDLVERMRVALFRDTP